MATTQSDLAEYQTDHDLLVVLNERVFALTTAVEKKNNDHETRLRLLEAGQEEQRGASKTWRIVFSALLAISIPAVAWLYTQFYTSESTFDKRVNYAITSTLKNYSLIQH